MAVTTSTGVEMPFARVLPAIAARAQADPPDKLPAPGK
jgi:hypothetical protein